MSASLFTSIETPRLMLRGITPADAPAIHRYMSDPEVTRWLPEGLLDSDGAAAFAVRNFGEDPQAVGVTLRGEGKLIGHMPYHPWFAPRTHEVGWVIGRPHQGQGYATEAAAALLGHAFEQLACHRVIATCQPQNPASWRVMEKLGMRREAHFRQCILRPGGSWWDEYFYALLAEEYFASRAVG